MGSILLYQDDDAIRSFVAEVLSDAGHQVLVCVTPQDVHRAAAADPTALALVDTWGANFTHLGDGEPQEIRDFAQRVPTVMLTAHAWAQQTQADELGLLALLSMPIELDLLLETIEQRLAALGGGKEDRDGVLGAPIISQP